MFKPVIKQSNIRGIAAGALATGEIPTTGTHYAIYLRCLTAAGAELTRAQIIADVGNIVVRINGKTKIEATATFLLDLQKYYGDKDSAGNDNGIIPIYLSRPNLPTDEERALYAWGMANVNSFTVDVSVTAVAQLASIEVYSEVTNENRVLGQHLTITKFPQSFATTGQQEITTLPKDDAQSGYLAMHIEAGSGTFSKVTVKLGQTNIWEEIAVKLHDSLNKKSGRVPQTGYYHIPFDRSNALSGFLPMASVKDFRQQITWITAAPGNFNIYAERVEGLNVVTR